jgi:GNAT superfamily N-acetyltransferase
MLTRLHPGPGLDTRLAALNPYYPLAMRCWVGWQDSRLPRRYFALEGAETVIAGAGGGWVLLGDASGFATALNDLISGNQQPQHSWPDERSRAMMTTLGADKIEFHLETVGKAGHEALGTLGWEPVANEHHNMEDGFFGAYFYCMTGAPRLGAEVRHAVEVHHGLNLYALMKQGVDYDSEGHYIRYCLSGGPSFLIRDAAGEPACWSCTHANRALGMIYTPPEHRRKGYARSLAAFQTDYMLLRDGYAYAAVLANNTASQGMMDSLGFPRMEPPMVGRAYRVPPGLLENI